MNAFALLRNAIRCAMRRDWMPARMWLSLFTDKFRRVPF